MKNHPDLIHNSDQNVGEKRRFSLTRRQFIKLSTSALVGAGLAAGGYASLLEPKMLEVTRVSLHQKRLPIAFDGIKIAHFSDLHLGFHTNADDVKRLVSVINQERPDLICFTGDMVDGPAEDMLEAVAPLSKLQAPLGVLSIVGNHDFENMKRLIALQKRAGFTVLRNENVLLERNGSRIAVVGLDDWLLGKPNPDRARRGIPENMYTLLLMHEPDYAGLASEHPFDLQLSGHSHGGQIRLPWFGEVITPPGSKMYIKGLYKIGDRDLRLYVNRGIGTTRLPFRFLCKPELTILTLNNRAQ